MSWGISSNAANIKFFIIMKFVSVFIAAIAAGVIWGGLFQ